MDIKNFDCIYDVGDDVIVTKIPTVVKGCKIIGNITRIHDNGDKVDVIVKEILNEGMEDIGEEFELTLREEGIYWVWTDDVKSLDETNVKVGKK